MIDRYLARRLVRAFFQDQRHAAALSKALGRYLGGPTPGARQEPGDPAFAERYFAVEEAVVARTGVAAFATQPTLMEMGSDPAQPLVATMVTAAKETAALLEEALAAGTWPGRDRVDRAGATSAEFLLAHSDAFPDLRGHALPVLRQAVLVGQASPRHYAHVVDRDCAFRGLPQPYGTVRLPEDGQLRFAWPAEGPAEINKRRKEIGLTSLEEDEARFQKGAKPGPALGPYRRMDYVREFWPFLPSGLMSVLTRRRR